MLQKEVIPPGKRYETSTWDPSRHLTARIDRDHEIVAYMHDECRNLQLREQFAGGSSQAPIVTNDLHNLSGKTDFSKGLVFIVAGLLVYFLPSLMAAGAGHHNKGAIFALNLFLGWSFLGWVAAFVWACTKPAPRVPIDHGDVLVARREPLM